MSKTIYVVASQTGTILSRLLKVITRAPYNHASISLEDDLSVMYSFGRRRAYNPFIGGFVAESARWGTFLRFPETNAAVVSIDVDDEVYAEMERYLAAMYSNRKSYSYNYLGLGLAAFNVPFKSENRFYCSEFVRHMLLNFGVVDKSGLGEITHPKDFLELPSANMVYRGLLREFSKENRPS